jgi:hypothetical protein
VLEIPIQVNCGCTALITTRLLKNCFQQPGRAVHGGIAQFSNTEVFEKWSKAKTALFALRAEKGQGGDFFSIFLVRLGNLFLPVGGVAW